MAKRWKKAEITYLKRYADKRRTAELADRFKTDDETVTAKLAELGLAAKDSVIPMRLEDDPLVKDYEKALASLHRKRWREAANQLKKVVAASDQPELTSRARRYLAVCEEQLGKNKIPPADDPFLEAVYERNRGNLDEALEICSRGGRQSKDERFAFLAASIHSLNGDLEKAAKFLELAIEMNAKNRIHAFHDADFSALRHDPQHARLFEPS